MSSISEAYINEAVAIILAFRKARGNNSTIREACEVAAKEIGCSAAKVQKIAYEKHMGYPYCKEAWAIIEAEELETKTSGDKVA